MVVEAAVAGIGDAVNLHLRRGPAAVDAGGAADGHRVEHRRRILPPLLVPGAAVPLDSPYLAQ